MERLTIRNLPSMIQFEGTFADRLRLYGGSAGFHREERSHAAVWIDWVDRW